MRIKCRILSSSNNAARRVGGKNIYIPLFKIPFGAEFEKRFMAMVTRAIKRDLKSVNLFIIDEMLELLNIAIEMLGRYF